MSDIKNIFERFQSQYQTGHVSKETTYYFSLGNEKYTLFARPDSCEVQNGKTVDAADCVIKADPKLFIDLVNHGKKPSAFDIARGKIKFSSMELALKLKDLFGVNIG